MVVFKIFFIHQCPTLSVCLDWNLRAEQTAQDEDGDENVRNASKKPAPTPKAKADTPDPGNNAGEADGSDSDESDESI